MFPRGQYPDRDWCCEIVPSLPLGHYLHSISPYQGIVPSGTCTISIILYLQRIVSVHCLCDIDPWHTPSSWGGGGCIRTPNFHFPQFFTPNFHFPHLLNPQFPLSIFLTAPFATMMATTVTSSIGSNTTTLALNTRPSCSTTSKTTNTYPSIEKKPPYAKCTPTPAQQHPKPHLVNKVERYTSQPSDWPRSSSTNSHTKDPQHKKLQQWEKDLKKREMHVSHSERQTAAHISTIISLKEKVKDLEQSNRCIKLEMTTSQHETDGTRSRHLPQNGRTTATTGHYVHNVHEPDNLGNLQRQVQEYTTQSN